LCKQLLYSIAEIVAKQKEKREGGK
jgi:hypothetical protein